MSRQALKPMWEICCLQERSTQHYSSNTKDVFFLAFVAGITALKQQDKGGSGLCVLSHIQTSCYLNPFSHGPLFLGAFNLMTK